MDRLKVNSQIEELDFRNSAFLVEYNMKSIRNLLNLESEEITFKSGIVLSQEVWDDIKSTLKIKY